jgi:cytoskeleton protein RodZ
VSDIESAEVTLPTAEAAPVAATSLGQQLREARLARGLSIEDVVHALKFSSRMIEAIETDHMDIASGSVFLRGSVRSYARFLKLDSEQLLGILDTQVPVQQPEILAPTSMGTAMSKNGNRQMLLLMAVSVLLLVVAGIMVSWHYLGDNINKVQNADGSAHAVIETSVVVPDMTPGAQSEEVTTAAQEKTAAAVSPPESGQPAAAATQSASAVAPVAQTVSIVPAAAPGASTSSAEGRRLLFEFKGESWIEVKDASGAVVLTGTYHGGTQSVVRRAPFEIVIGNASFVTLKDDGKPVNLAPYTQAEVARLTLK